MKELIIRSLSGLVYVALILLATTTEQTWLFLLIFSLIMLGCLYEFYKLRGLALRWENYLAMIFALLSFVIGNLVVKSPQYSTFLTNSFVVLFFIFALFLIALIPFILSESSRGRFINVYYSLIYILPAFAVISALHNDSTAHENNLLLVLMILVWCADVGAYCFGSLFGQGERGHKLMPSISPKKSWEGFIGGAVVCVIVALFLKPFECWGAKESSVIQTIIFSLIFYFVAVMGDLFESKLKRIAGVKDSGKIMPGHGGFLDRFDSVLFAFPVAIVLMLILTMLFTS